MLQDKALSVKAMMNSLRVSSLKTLVNDLPDLKDVTVVYDLKRAKTNDVSSGLPTIIPLSRLPPPVVGIDVLAGSFKIQIGGTFGLLPEEQRAEVLAHFLPRDLVSFGLVSRSSRDALLKDCNFSNYVWSRAIKAFFGPVTGSLAIVLRNPRAWYYSWRKKCLCYF